MEKNINSTQLVERCFELSVELASQRKKQRLLEAGLKDTLHKSTALTAQINELAEILRSVGIDDEQLVKEFSIISKRKVEENKKKTQEVENKK